MSSSKKPIRFARVVSRLARGLLLVELVERRPRSSKIDRYQVARLSCDYGTAFRVAKVGGEVYAVNLGGDGEPPSCECLGFLAHGTKTVCKHVASLRALLAAGKLS